MKKKSNLFNGTLLLILISTSSSLIAESGGNGEVQYAGGNGEVIHNECMNLLDKKQRNQCIDKIYPTINVAIKVITKALKIIQDRGDDGAVIHENLNLENKERIILNLNIEEAEKEISCNIKTADIQQDEKTATLDILVSDIEEHLIIYNKNGDVIVDYNVTK